MPDLDLDAVAAKWLNQCGLCDYGMPEYGCTHPGEDHRPVILSLVEEVKRLRRRAEVAVDVIARAGGHIHLIETRGRVHHDRLQFVLDQIHAAMGTLNPRLLGVPDSPGGRCDWCKRKPCEVCAGNGCGDCPECSPHVPEVDD